MIRSACHLSGRLILSIISIVIPMQAVAELTERFDENHRILTVRILKGLDFDGWDGEINAGENIADSSKASLDERLNVRLYRIQGYQPRWKVDQSLQFQYDHSFSNNSGLLLALSQQEYRDQSSQKYLIDHSSGFPAILNEPTLSAQEFFQSNSNDDRIGTTNISAGGRLVTENGIALEGLVGPVFDHRNGVSQEGIKYDFNYNFRTDSIVWNGEGWLSHFGSGDDHNLIAGAGGSYGLSDAANDQFNVIYQTGSRREFSAVGGDYGRRNDRRVEFNNNLSVNISESMDLDWDSDLTNKTTENASRSSGRRDREFNWRNQLEGGWSQEGKFVIIGSGVDIQQQEYAGGLTQGRASRLSITTGIESPSLDSTVLESLVSRYRFDTPDESDYNDRDELRWRFAIRTSKHLTSTVSVRGGMEANMNHLVYIHRSRSGENRWTRQFTLFGEVPWQDRIIENKARFAVSAHYTDYDFAPFDLTRSRLYRTFSVVDTFRVGGSDGWGGEICSSGQLNDHGDLDWAEWIENVSERGYTTTLSILPHWNTTRSEVAVGWLMQRRFSTVIQDNDENITDEDVWSYGPVARIFLSPAINVRLEFLATFLSIERPDQRTESLPDINFTFIWTL